MMMFEIIVEMAVQDRFQSSNLIEIGFVLITRMIILTFLVLLAVLNDVILFLTVNVSRGRPKIVFSSSGYKSSESLF